MKYVGYCSYHKVWLTQADLDNKPKCMNFDRFHIKKKLKMKKESDAKCKYLFLVDKEIKNE